MHIAIDARMFSWTGIGRYTRNLLSGLGRLSSAHRYSVLLSEADMPGFFALKLPSGRFEAHRVPGECYSWTEQTILLTYLYRLKADIFHFTHFNVPRLFSRPYVVTIHDITRFIFPGQVRQSIGHQLAYEYLFKHAAERARAIISVSNTTRDDLLQLPLTLPHLRPVIYEGIEEVFFKPVTQHERRQLHRLLALADPYVLFVGIWMSHKNIRRLLEAFAQIHAIHPHLKLVITGQLKPGYVAVAEYVRKLHLENQVVLPGFIPHHLMPALYTEATCLIFPSLYEGVGLPALEAAACGTPVVASNISSLPEIMGNAALYVNPEYVPNIVGMVRQVIENKEVADSLRERGLARASHFRWNKAVKQHQQVYESAL